MTRAASYPRHACYLLLTVAVVPALKPDVLPLNRNAVISAVVKVIEEHIPELMALNLSGNRLSSLHNLSRLVEKTPNLVGLDLSDNPEVMLSHFMLTRVFKVFMHQSVPQLRESELDKLSGWNLTEINLSGTPICAKNHDQALYLRYSG